MTQVVSFTLDNRSTVKASPTESYLLEMHESDIIGLLNINFQMPMKAIPEHVKCGIISDIESNMIISKQ